MRREKGKVVTVKDLKGYRDGWFSVFKPDLSSSDQRAMYWFSKIVEEVGELSEALTAKMGLQRDKGKAYSVEEEIADVILSAMLLAVELGYDPYEITNKKFSVISRRLEEIKGSR